AGLLAPRLLEEACRLVVGVVQLGEAVGDLLRVDEQLEALGELRVGIAAAREGRDLGRKIDDESRIDEMLFGNGLEEHQLQSAPALPAAVLDPQPGQLFREELALAQVALDALLADGVGEAE